MSSRQNFVILALILALVLASWQRKQDCDDMSSLLSSQHRTVLRPEERHHAGRVGEVVDYELSRGKERAKGRKVQKLHGFQASLTVTWSRGLIWKFRFPSNGLATPGMTSVIDFASTKREAHRVNARRVSGSQSNVRHPFQAAYHSNIDQTISVHPPYRVHPSINTFRLAFDSQGIAVQGE